nr:DUF1484 family protein [Cupriavidus taiwanensis]
MQAVVGGKRANDRDGSFSASRQRHQQQQVRLQSHPGIARPDPGRLGSVLSLLEVESERSEGCHGVHCLLAMIKMRFSPPRSRRGQSPHASVSPPFP